MIEILGWATSRAVARQFLETCQIADWDADLQVMVARADVQLHPFRASESVTVTRQTGVDGEGNPILETLPGFHFNLRVYGQLEQTLRQGAPGGGDPENPGLWNYSKLKTYIDNKLGVVATQRNKEVTGARLPGGYEWSIGPNAIRLFDATAVNNRANVWA